MNEKILSEVDFADRCKHVFEFFTKPERLHQSIPPSAMILTSGGVDIRSYYIMEGYTDNCVYLDIREMFRKFRQDDQIPCSVQIMSELQQVGLEIARFCLRSRYDLAIDLTGNNENNYGIVVNSLRCLGYQSYPVLFDLRNNPYIDVDPDDFGGILVPSVWEKQHTDWIYHAALSIVTGE